MIIREGQRKVIMPDRIGERERDRGILCAGEETETATPGAPTRPRKTANPRNYLEVSCFRLTRAFETSGINSVPYYRFSIVTGSTERLRPENSRKRRRRSLRSIDRSNDPRSSKARSSVAVVRRETPPPTLSRIPCKIPTNNTSVSSVSERDVQICFREVYIL